MREHVHMCEQHCPTAANAQVRPGPAWRGLLLAPEAADWLLDLLPALRGAAATLPLARGARQLTVHCSPSVSSCSVESLVTLAQWEQACGPFPEGTKLCAA